MASGGIKKCVVCGKEFHAIRANHISCSRQCARVRNKEIDNERSKRNRDKNKAAGAMPQSNHNKIADIAAAARKERMTYGQYVAKYMRDE